MARSGAAVLLSAALFIGAGDLPRPRGAVVFAEDGDTDDDDTTVTPTIVDSGECGDNLTWTLDADGTLTISGTAAKDALSLFKPVFRGDLERSVLRKTYAADDSVFREADNAAIVDFLSNKVFRDAHNNVEGNIR